MQRIGLSLRSLLSLLLLSVALFSCEKGIVFEGVSRVDDSSWDLNNVVEFEWNVLDSTLSYDIYIVLQHNERYAYRNLFLFTESKLGENNLGRDTLAAFLARADGRWTGEGSGALISHRFPFKMNHRFDRQESYLVSIQHGMRDLELEGIEQIGLLIKEHVSVQE